MALTNFRDFRVLHRSIREHPRLLDESMSVQWKYASLSAAAAASGDVVFFGAP